MNKAILLVCALLLSCLALAPATASPALDYDQIHYDAGDAAPVVAVVTADPSAIAGERLCACSPDRHLNSTVPATASPMPPGGADTGIAFSPAASGPDHWRT